MVTKGWEGDPSSFMGTDMKTTSCPSREKSQIRVLFVGRGDGDAQATPEQNVESKPLPACTPNFSELFFGDLKFRGRD